MSWGDPAQLLARLDDLSARRPLAARVVTLAGNPQAGARDVARLLSADVALAARVLRLANSAAYGLGGRVRTLPLAVTVVGVRAVRAVAAAALAGVDDTSCGAEQVLPPDFWTRCRLTAVGCSQLAGRFDVPAADAFCLGLLTGLGQVVLAQADPAGYRAVLGDAQVVAGGRASLRTAEQARYGVCSTQLSAAALESWGFPEELGTALRDVDVDDQDPRRGPTSAWVLLLRTALALTSLVLEPDAGAGADADLAGASGGAVGEEEAAALVVAVRDAITRADW